MSSKQRDEANKSEVMNGEVADSSVDVFTFCSLVAEYFFIKLSF